MMLFLVHGEAVVKAVAKKKCCKIFWINFENCVGFWHLEFLSPVKDVLGWKPLLGFKGIKWCASDPNALVAQTDVIFFFITGPQKGNK